MNNRKNIISAIILQVVTIISGLILPRLILSTFNSEINGLVSSITQFLSFISLVEGGLGAVVLAELYKPIEQRNDSRIKEILSECQNYFGKMAIVFIIYTLVLSIVYPLACSSDLSFGFISSLVVILSFSTLVKYLFSITYKLYLQACQKIYIVNYCSIIIVILNLIIAYITITYFQSVHVVKIAADILFIIQPIVFNRIVENKYHVKLKITKKNNNVLKDRWSGFAQNLAHFINMNTDITVITVMIGLKEVSVYSVYMLAIAALRNLISLISNTYQSALGKYNASGNIKLLKEKFINLQRINWIISLVFYGTCFVLINEFVGLYTKGVNDINYYQPVFSGIIILATLLFSICEPQRFLILAIGKFKEIKKIYIIEAGINIVLSVLLSIKIGLIGVAIGTLVGVSVRFIYFVLYLRKNVINIEIKNYISLFILTLIYFAGNLAISHYISFTINNFIEFILYGGIFFLIELMFGLIYYVSSRLYGRMKIGIKTDF